jgi:hypothetical protein
MQIKIKLTYISYEVFLCVTSVSLCLCVERFSPKK